MISAVLRLFARDIAGQLDDVRLKPRDHLRPSLRYPWIVASVGRGQAGQAIERTVVEPVDRPFVHRPGPECSVEADRRRVPVEHRPFEFAEPSLDAPAGPWSRARPCRCPGHGARAARRCLRGKAQAARGMSRTSGTRGRSRPAGCRSRPRRPRRTHADRTGAGGNRRRWPGQISPASHRPPALVQGSRWLRESSGRAGRIWNASSVAFGLSIRSLLMGFVLAGLSRPARWPGSSRG